MTARRLIAPLAAAVLLALAAAAQADTIANVDLDEDPCRQHLGPDQGVLRPPDDRYGDVVVLCTGETILFAGDVELLTARLPRGYELVQASDSPDFVWGFWQPIPNVLDERVWYSGTNRTLRARLYNLSRVPRMRVRLFVLGVRQGTDVRPPFAPAFEDDVQGWDLAEWRVDPELQGGDDARDLAERWHVSSGPRPGVWWLRQGDGPLYICAPSRDELADYELRRAEYLGPCELWRYSEVD